ncbi:MAG: 23S rRNA (adenine(2503)-C(2))-methyltransferase RlmN [Treponema sp.]|jgi:23S rRNA (adenine2503-C2)-methyltransferase|nr:23S rRNA (adenine(2503)-C(2))-methyltransferase RlmN [Treponema sp.]
MKNISGNISSIIDLINDPFGFSYDEISPILGEDDAKALYVRLYRGGLLKKPHTIWVQNIISATDAKKYLFELSDGKRIETVCIKRKTGVTACVSAQVGCPVQCIFCASGRPGHIRNLTASEIVQQIIFLREPINRIVFMGIGEPLYNYDSVLKSIHILRDRNGLDFPTDGITVSTVGPIKLLKQLREEHLKIQLTLSLHAATQEVRNYLIPGMKGNDINQTVEAALDYSRRHNRKLTVAYLVLPGINNAYTDARQLAAWFAQEKVMINLLEYNPTPQSTLKKPAKQEIERFKNHLERLGLETHIRVSHGNAIQAACGQLAGAIR